MATPLSPDLETQAQQLAAALQALLGPEVLELARTLVAADSPFGQTEFDLRRTAQRLVAKSLQHHLAQKKTATSAPASPA